jgi:hypothetical protein
MGKNYIKMCVVWQRRKKKERKSRSREREREIKLVTLAWPT